MHYFCVVCEYCGKPIPLLEHRRGPYQYDLPDDEFSVKHSDHEPESGCSVPAMYDPRDVQQREHPAIKGFASHPEFKERRTE